MTNKVRTQKNSLHAQYSFLSKFDKESYELYAKIKGAKNNKMKPNGLRKRAIYLCQPFDPPECIMEMIKLREKDQYAHIKAWQGLQFRFTDKSTKARKRISENPDVFWRNMVTRMFTRQVVEEWQGLDGKRLAIKHIKELWDKQEGLCALSGHNMQLRVGSMEDWNYMKASPDRIDSSKPYGPGNIHLVCSFANHMKLDMTMKQFKKFVKDIAIHNKMFKDA